MKVCVPSDYQFQILKPFYLFKQTNKKGRQSLEEFPGPEIPWTVKGSHDVTYFVYTQINQSVM